MKILCAVVLICITASLSESLTPREYIKLKEMKNKDREAKIVIETYLDGLVEGIRGTHSFFGIKKFTSLYCEPDELTLNRDNYIQILDTALEREKDKESFKESQDKSSLGFWLLQELQRIFPCQGAFPAPRR